MLPAHSLKSSARQLGAVRLSELAKDIEQAAKSGNLHPSIATLAALVEETAAALAQAAS